jgi:hypothetical protein
MGDPGKAPTFEIFRGDDGWYVFCHDQRSGDGNTVYINRKWRVTAVTYGPPPLGLPNVRPQFDAREASRKNEPPEYIGQEAIYSHTICADGAPRQTMELRPPVAKAILVARGRGIGAFAGGRGYGAQQYEAVVFEVFELHDGWYVFCHGGMAGSGRTVRIDMSWNAAQPTYGPPFPAGTMPTTQPAG